MDRDINSISAKMLGITTATSPNLVESLFRVSAQVPRLQHTAGHHDEPGHQPPEPDFRHVAGRAWPWALAGSPLPARALRQPARGAQPQQRSKAQAEHWGPVSAAHDSESELVMLAEASTGTKAVCAGAGNPPPRFNSLPSLPTGPCFLGRRPLGRSPPPGARHGGAEPRPSSRLSACACQASCARAEERPGGVRRKVLGAGFPFLSPFPNNKTSSWTRLPSLPTHGDGCHEKLSFSEDAGRCCI